MVGAWEQVLLYLLGHRYLRSEMDTPEFNQRFGILLEAYLRGCGEKMFVSFIAL